jgi:hypothetical protein
VDAGRWVDPRGARPPLSVPLPSLVGAPEEIFELVRLIRAGRVYSVEESIRAGKPIQARSYRLEKRSVDSPLGPLANDLIAFFKTVRMQP